MISSFFGKTKPIHYIVLSVFLFHSVFLFFGFGTEFNVEVLPMEILVLGTLLPSIYIISRMVKTGKVTVINVSSIYLKDQL